MIVIQKCGLAVEDEKQQIFSYYCSVPTNGFCCKITTGIIIHDIYKYYKNKRKQKDIYVYMIYIYIYLLIIYCLLLTSLTSNQIVTKNPPF